jgi:UDP-2,4-diacetamido-2,4,6-trideoxy-beta-L-altropyranose hydrolase
MRCLTLAQALIAVGYHVRIGCIKGSDEIVPALARSGVEIISLTKPFNPGELLDAVASQVNLVVFDQYEIDAVYERAFRTIADTILVIDDLADREHDCDILVDQTFRRNAIDYKHLVPSSATVLTGSQYALLRPEFAAAREAALARRASASRAGRILITMGLTDVDGITIKVLDAVLAAEAGITIDVVLGPNALSLGEVRERAARYNNITIHLDTSDLCALMAAADLSVGAGGTTTWERCCLGLPSVVLVLADNQRFAMTQLVANGAVCLASGPIEVKHKVAELVSNYDLLKAVSDQCARITDGRGVAHVLSAIASREGNNALMVCVDG